MTDNNKKIRKRYSRLIDQRNGEQQRQQQEQKQDQNKEAISIDDHILRIKRALNEFVDEVENNSFFF
jgi:hypothetical protein